MYLYDTILVTDRGFVFCLLSNEQLTRIERAFGTRRNISVIIRMENGREVEAKQVLCCYGICGEEE